MLRNRRDLNDPSNFVDLYAISYDFWKTFKRLDIDHHSVIFLQGQGFDYFCHQYCAYQNTQVLQLIQRVQ